jgi:hypothetical protein
MPTPIVFEECRCGTCRRLWSDVGNSALRSGLYGHGTGYGYAQRGAVSIHLSEWDEHDPKRTGVVVYLYVSDADAVRAEWVESRCGAVAVGQTYPFPPLSSGGALVARP